MELSVYNKNGVDTGRKVSLPSHVFGITPNEHVVWLDVKQFLANQRQGTHKAKERSEVAYSTKKIKKQKGTGTARAGSIKSPHFVGGGRAHGPRPRDYRFKVNVKTKKLARFSALSDKATQSNIIVLEDFTVNTPKTKEYLSVLKNLKVDSAKTLLVLTKHDSNVYLSSRNIPNSHVLPFESLNTYEIMKAQKLVLFEGTIQKFANAKK
jgi:large subunit ribosomal protein L4